MPSDSPDLTLLAYLGVVLGGLLVAVGIAAVVMGRRPRRNRKDSNDG